MEEKLTESDFHRPPEGYFACPKCGMDATNIVRDRQRKYIAEVRCSNHSCQRSLKRRRWLKCRVCCSSNTCKKPVLSRPAEHLTGKGHQNHAANFEATKTQAYVIRENSFLHRGTILQHQGTCTTTSSNNNNNEKASTTNSEPEDMNVDLEQPEEDEDEDDLQMPSTEETVVPQTVEDWRLQIMSNCFEANADLSLYFPPPETEKVGKETRKPLNRAYHRWNLHHRHGPRFLYAHAIQQNTGPKTVTDAASKTTLWCMLLAMLAARLTGTDRFILLAVLSYMNEVAKDILPVPLNPAMLRRMYIDGFRSIPNILPRPVIRTLESGFAYVPIRDVLQYHLAHGQSIDPFVDLPHVDKEALPALHASSPRGKELIRYTITEESQLQGDNGGEDLLRNFPAEVIIWSDGFDANDTKNNRGSTHVILVSIGTPEGDYHSGCNTYPVSIGPADGDLSEVAHLIAEDLKKLFKKDPEPNIFFDGASKKEISILLLVFCLLQDRPERCSWLSLAYGNGKYAGRFGWAGDLDQPNSFNFFPSCEECNQMRMNGTNRECFRCCNWGMADLSYVAPDDYPTNFEHVCPTPQDEDAPADLRVNHEGTWYLPFRKISFACLRKNIDFAFQMIDQGIWRKKEGKTYLETFALSPDYITEICNAADSHLEQPPYPSSWEIPRVDIRHHVDVPMHLCFLGVTKANSADLLEGWLKSKRMSTSFHTKSHPVLAEIKKLSLSWCKAETTFGGYVSENWIAYSRIYKYVNRLISCELEATDKVYEDPVGVAMSQYTFTEKRSWLCARKVDGITTRTKKKTVEEKFDYFLALPAELLPGIPDLAASSATVAEVDHMIACWQVCISRIMSLDQNPDTAHLQDIDRHVKLFLSAVHVFDSSRMMAQSGPGKKKTKPVWRVKPNFLGLLNIAAAIKEMGPIRMLTELDHKGEASIKFIKKWIQQGLKGNWAYNAMLGFYREKSFKYVLKDCLQDVTESSSDDSDDQTGKLMLEIASNLAGEPIFSEGKDGEGTDEAAATRYKCYRQFKDQASAVASLSGNEAVSGVVHKDRLYLVVKKSDGKPAKTFVPIKPSFFIKQFCGADYFSYNEVVLSGGNDEPSSSGEFFLLLPLLGDDGSRLNGIFYLITSKWREVISRNNGGYSLELPRVPGAVY